MAEQHANGDPAAPNPPDDIDPIVEAFEQAWQRMVPDIAAFLPPEASKQRRRDVLCALIEVDLEFRWQG